MRTGHPSNDLGVAHEYDIEKSREEHNGGIRLL